MRGAGPCDYPINAALARRFVGHGAAQGVDQVVQERLSQADWGYPIALSRRCRAFSRCSELTVGGAGFMSPSRAPVA